MKSIIWELSGVFEIPVELPDFQEIGIFDDFVRLKHMRKLDVITKPINQVHSNFFEPRKYLCYMGPPKPMVDLIVVVARNMI
jgi:hypothetical protein